jgi:hypothetical protein
VEYIPFCLLGTVLWVYGAKFMASIIHGHDNYRFEDLHEMPTDAEIIILSMAFWPFFLLIITGATICVSSYRVCKRFLFISKPFASNKIGIWLGKQLRGYDL